MFGTLPAPLRVYDYAAGLITGAGEPGFRPVVPGRAFWVLSRTPQPLSITGLAVNPTVTARLPLSAGWNLIATPWLSAVEWTDARVSVRVGSETVVLSEAVTRGWLDGTLQQYVPASASYASFAPNASPSGALRVWEGSATFAHVACELVLAPPPPDTQAPTISLSPMPTDGQEVTAPTEIIGSVDDPNLAEWRLEIAPVGTSTFTTFALGSTPVTNATLGTLDPTLLLNGQYQVRFVATDVFGQTSAIAWSVTVNGDMKVGNFRIAFVDLEVPVAGLPIDLTRVYDSRDKGRGEFGIGWRLELSNARLAENRKAGADWVGTRSGGLLPTYCVQPARPQRVTITLPDGRLLEFEPTVSPQCQQILPPSQVTLGFAALPGTRGTLQPLDADLALVATSWPSSPGQSPADLLDFSTAGQIDPDLYRLTLPDGRAFVIHQHDGLQSVRDANGNQLAFAPGGITHSAGRAVIFTRDALGRITRITDPNGNFMTYAYDAAGDLVTFTDRETNSTSFAYNGSHGLLTITDPLGHRPIRNDYDAGGRLIRQTDALGRTLEYTHDVAGRREVVTDRLGRARVLTYDARGNVIHEVDAEGHVTTRSFDAHGNRSSETDPLGHVREWTYDARDNLIRERDALGQVTTRTYNAANQVLTKTGPRGDVTRYEYDARGNLTRVTGADGGVTQASYDAAGNLLTRSDPLGGTQSFAYNAAGDEIRQTDAAGHVTTRSFDANGNPLGETRTRVVAGITETLTTSYTYDKTGLVTRLTDPAGGVTLLSYDAAGREASVTDALGRTRRYEHDEAGHLVRTVHADGTTTTSAWDAEGRLVNETDRAGRTTRHEYDALGRLVRTLASDGSATTRAYDAAGRLISEGDALGRLTRHEYDAAGNVTRTLDASGGVIQRSYDAAGNPTSVTDALGATTVFAYDALDRLVSTTSPDGSTTGVVYDAAGRRASETDAAGRTTAFAYDARGLLTSITDPSAGVTAFTYDEQARLATQTDALGRVTRYAHDRTGRLIRRQLPDGAQETFVYDAAGQRVARIDFAGRTVGYDYDAEGRLLRRRYPDGSRVEFTYSPTGRRLSARDARGLTTYAYDARDRLTALVYPDGRRLDYAYDLAGNRTALAVDLGSGPIVTRYAYDALNRVVGVTDPSGRVYTAAYDAAGRRSSSAFPNGTASVSTHDARGRLTSLATVAPGGSLQHLAYAYGPTGRVARRDGPGAEVRAYAYDALERLTSEAVTASVPYSKTFTHDAVGNRLAQSTVGSGAPGSPAASGSVSYVYDSRDRLTDVSAQTYAWDANGSLTSQAGEALYVWDFDHRLVRVERADGTLVEHAYDVDGNRVRSVTTLPGGAPQARDYLVDPSARLSHVVAETDGALLGALYVRAGDELLALLRPQGAAFSTRFYHADGQGSVRLLTDEAGQVTDRYDYTAFGELLAHVGSDPQPYTYAGEPFEAPLGWSYNRARWLDPRSGRFTSEDPLPGVPEEPRTLHRYAYVGGDPINSTDPSGLFEFSLAGLNVNLSIQSTLRSISQSRPIEFLTRGLRNKKWDIFFTVRTTDIAWFIPHVYIYAERRGTGSGFSYDVGPGSVPTPFRPGNILDVIGVDGFLTVRPTTRAQATGAKLKVAAHTNGQFGLWNGFAVAAAFEPPGVVTITYSFLGPFRGLSCLSWSVKAAAAAAALQVFPIQ